MESRAVVRRTTYGQAHPLRDIVLCQLHAQNQVFLYQQPAPNQVEGASCPLNLDDTKRTKERHQIQ